MSGPDWSTHEPPWLAKLRPDIEGLNNQTDQHAARELDPDRRAAWLVEQLERAAAGRVPPALAGPGWREGHIAEYQEEPSQPVMRLRTRGPWPCQLPERLGCPDCDRRFDTKLALAVHAVDHRRRQKRKDKRAKAAAAGVDKPKPGARTKHKKRRR